MSLEAKFGKTGEVLEAQVTALGKCNHFIGTQWNMCPAVRRIWNTYISAWRRLR